MPKLTSQEQLTTKIKENYQSIILGALVIIVGLSTLMKVSSNKSGTSPITNKKEAGAIEKKDGNKIPTKVPMEGTKYAVKRGDTLWLIAERNYDSGYAWIDIAKANKLANANHIITGQRLALPKLAVAKKSTTGQITESKPANTMAQTKKVTLQSDKYTIVRGDTLWSIAVRAYGDGYAWPKIAKANNLKNPNLIHSKNVLKLPR